MSSGENAAAANHPRRSPNLETTLAVYYEAQRQKRLANRHRRRAAMLMEEFCRFKSDLESMGIKVVIESQPPLTNTPGGTSEHSNRRST